MSDRDLQSKINRHAYGLALRYYVMLRREIALRIKLGALDADRLDSWIPEDSRVGQLPDRGENDPW